MPWFKLTLAYDGTDFSGWQSQPGRRTVQAELERAWREITGETVRVTAAGRTDAGVHAAGQVVGVESGTRIEPRALVLALNAKLPEDVAVRRVEPAHEGFHATTHAKGKCYRYTIYNDRRRPIFWRRYAWHLPLPLDADAMHQAAQHLAGTHDFASFQSAGSERESTVRTLFTVTVRAQALTPPDQASQFQPRSPSVSIDNPTMVVLIEVTGDGFLYNMVRTIAGTLVEVGRGKRDPAWVAEVLAARDRTQAGQTAPPHGLTLLWVYYD